MPSKKENREPADDPRLQEAVRELLLANEGFRRAYEMWERAPGPEAGAERRLLDEAQDRLVFARDHVTEVESSLRRPRP